MAYDENLADRIRELVGNESELTEQEMFGGLAFLIGGNMAVAASGQGGILVRVDPAQSDALVATTNARLMEMRGRPMRGVATSGPGRSSHQTPARQVGGAWHDVRPLAPCEAIGRATLAAQRLRLYPSSRAGLRLRGRSLGADSPT
jgi:hypothetical protein